MNWTVYPWQPQLVIRKLKSLLFVSILLCLLSGKTPFVLPPQSGAIFIFCSSSRAASTSSSSPPRPAAADRQTAADVCSSTETFLLEPIFALDALCDDSPACVHFHDGGVGGWSSSRGRLRFVCSSALGEEGKKEQPVCSMEAAEGEEHLSARRCGATDAADASEGGDVRACTHGGREFLKTQQIPIRFFQLQPLSSTLESESVLEKLIQPFLCFSTSPLLMVALNEPMTKWKS